MHIWYLMIVGLILIGAGLLMFQRGSLKLLVMFVIPVGFFVFVLGLVSFLFNNQFFIILLVAYLIFIVIYGKIHYKKIIVKKIQIDTQKKIGHKEKKMKILFLSDFHYDITHEDFSDEHFTRLINKVNSLEYDLLLLGGDYINYANNIEHFFQRLKEIKRPELGIYAVTGNHDYVDHKQVIETLEQMDIPVLNNEFLKINPELNLKIFGVEDSWYGEPSIEGYRMRIHENNFNILLSHEPDFVSFLPDINQVDLVLSGHYHAGQVNLLFIPIHRLITHFGYGLYNHKKATLYTTSGVGGTFGRGRLGMRLRFGSTAEIVQIEINEEQDADRAILQS